MQIQLWPLLLPLSHNIGVTEVEQWCNKPFSNSNNSKDTEIFLETGIKQFPTYAPVLLRGVLGNTRFLDDRKFSFGSLGLLTVGMRDF